ncbi:ankyrin repeat domain-containing protein [Shewanella chilikensis]|uniref:ankyrin repeat domain-containing protein n=1 Tax=Shewanella chilikensis TaxID=558541 RepID=UPI003A9841FD
MDFFFSILYRFINAPIFEAIENSQEEEVYRLIERPSIVSAKDKWGRTPLIAAASANMPKVVEKLIQNGSDVNYVSNKNGSTAMCAASMVGATEVAKLLIAAGADPDQDSTDPDKTCEKMTPLMWASNRGHADFAELLVESGVNLDKVDGGNTTALMYAAMGGGQNMEVFEVLIKHEPNLEIKDWRGRSVLDEARDRDKNSNKPEMKNLIKKYYGGLDI